MHIVSRLTSPTPSELIHGAQSQCRHRVGQALKVEIVETGTGTGDRIQFYEMPLHPEILQYTPSQSLSISRRPIASYHRCRTSNITKWPKAVRELWAPYVSELSGTQQDSGSSFLKRLRTPAYQPHSAAFFLRIWCVEVMIACRGSVERFDESTTEAKMVSA